MEKVHSLSNNNTRKNRDINIELFRIILMLMIVTLHYLGHGGILDSINISDGKKYYFVWFLEVFSYIGVDGFVIISGFYLVTSKFKISKLLTLFLQVTFISSAIYFTLVALDRIPLNYNNLIDALFPVFTGWYWFPTSYIALYCLFPFLNIIIHSISKREMQILVILTSLMFCAWNAFFPKLVLVNTDKGYNVVWFICLYLFAAYLRLYWDFKINKWLYLFVYILCCTFVFYKKCQGNDAFLSYISIPIVIAALSLFLFFKEVHIKYLLLCKIIAWISPLTFGVYLISDNRWVRQYLYTKILHTTSFAHSSSLIYVTPLSVILIFIVCMLIDKVRLIIFNCFTKSREYEKICDKIIRFIKA